MRQIRVLVVDDSVMVRRLISRMLGEYKEFKVIGTAVDGEDAINKIKALKPDVVTLDLEMPVKDGLEVLKHLMKTDPVPVIMVSAYTTEGARATIEALSLGALDFVPKAVSPNLIKSMVKELALKIRLVANHGKSMRGNNFSVGGRTRCKALKTIKEDRQPLSKTHPHSRGDNLPPRSHNRNIDLVVIGSSTGGPSALNRIIPALPQDLKAGVIIVQHLPVGFSSSLAENLNRKSKIMVKLAEHDDMVSPGLVLVAPAGFSCSLKRGASGVGIVLDVDSSPLPPGGFRPSVDKVMLSAAETYKDRVMGVLLTGMGRDGAVGMAAIRNQGGYTVAESETTCVVFGMPRAAIEAGAVSAVLPLDDIAKEIIHNIG